MTIRAREQDSAPSHLRVSVACFRWNGDEIETILVDDDSLPSAYPGANESLNEAADRIVQDLFGTPAAYTEQLYTFDLVSETHRETNVSYLALFAPAASSSFSWIPASVTSNIAPASQQVLDYAFVRLRAKLEYTSIAFHLMPDTFTVAALQLAYESILGRPLDKRNFRRRMISSGMLEPTGEKRREGPHRPAELYRYSGQTDRSSYLTPPSTPANRWQEPES